MIITLKDQIIRIERQNELEFKIDEEIKKSNQLAEDNKILLEKIELLELEKGDLVDKVKNMEEDNLNLMK